MSRSPLLLLAAFTVAACDAREPVGVGQSSLQAAPVARTVAWGSGANELGLRPRVAERLAIGAPAVAVGPRGEVVLLDALRGRVVRLDERTGELVTIAEVDKDADDLALGADGTIAVRHQTTTKIDVFAWGGARVGELDASAVRDVDTLEVGVSRRVLVVNPYQETFLLGSPSAALAPNDVAFSKREGAAFLPDRAGVVVVRGDDGKIELRVVARGTDGRAVVRSKHPIGEGAAARVVGVTGNIACLRVEDVVQAAAGELQVRRQAVCVDATNGKRVFSTDLPAPGSYVPRRELAYARGKLAFVLPTESGLRVSSWSVEGGAR